jgi:deoxycytidine triphosphate deaminase
MLSHTQIDERLYNKQIQLWYSFLPDDSDARAVFKYYREEQRVDLSQPEEPATRFFLRNRYSTHVHLTAGPIIQTHHNLRIKDRRSNRHYQNCYDVLEQKKIVFEPFEVLTILTNERIALDGKTVALVTPRVTNTDAGLLLATAYIDPFYQGIMRVIMCNLTSSRQTLRVLEPLAQCFFFDLSTGVAESYARTFSNKSSYYALDWARVLEGDGEPFPRRKKPDPKGTRLEQIKQAVTPYLTFDRVIKVYTPATAVGAALLGAVYYGRDVAATVQAFPLLKAGVERLDKGLSRIDKAIPQVGSTLIVVPRGVKEGRQFLNINIRSQPQARVWLTVDRASASSSDEVDLSYRLTPIGNTGDAAVEIIAKLRAEAIASDVRVPVLWMITRDAP